MPPAFAWIEYAFWGVLAVGILFRLSIALFRRRAGRRKDAVRSALGPVMGAGAAQSAAYGWTPPPVDGCHTDGAFHRDQRVLGPGAGRSTR